MSGVIFHPEYLPGRMIFIKGKHYVDYDIEVFNLWPERSWVDVHMIFEEYERHHS